MLQDEALKILKTGANVFLTGEPGSGKTHTVNAYVKWLRNHGIEPAITASTGIAATHIGGMTIHSWSGIGARDFVSDFDIAEIADKKNVKRRARGTQVLIIDEISMLSGELLSAIDRVLRLSRERNTPFGGMQVVVVGDFFQLPPIRKSEDSSFAFRERTWGELNPIVCYLEEQHRHADRQFGILLQSIRSGTAMETAQKMLRTRFVNEHSAPKDAPQLFSHNKDVDYVNTKRLEQMSGSPRAYTMTSRGPESVVMSLKRGCLSPETLTLKEGARVMFTKNDLAGRRFANGTLGEVISIAGNGTPTVKTTDGREIIVEPMEWVMQDGGRIVGRITQLPLRLAWAITVHKSQGMTLDAAVVYLAQAFEYGQGYVALSRVRNLSGLHVLGLNERALEVHPEVRAHDAHFKKHSADARAYFGNLGTQEHMNMVHRFIKASGGSVEGGVAPKIRKTRMNKESTLDATLALMKSGKNIKEIARARELKEGTIIDHLEQLYMKNEITREGIERMAPPALRRALPRIKEVFTQHSYERLSPVHRALKGVYSFDDLKLARVLLS